MQEPKEWGFGLSSALLVLLITGLGAAAVWLVWKWLRGELVQQPSAGPRPARKPITKSDTQENERAFRAVEEAIPSYREKAISYWLDELAAVARLSTEEKARLFDGREPVLGFPAFPLREIAEKEGVPIDRVVRAIELYLRRQGVPIDSDAAMVVQVADFVRAQAKAEAERIFQAFLQTQAPPAPGQA